MKQSLRVIWSYRGFVLSSVKKEFQSKYRNSLIGAAWNVINPLSMILVYTLIFTGIMKTRLPGIESNFGYSIFLCSGILVWGLFAEIVNRSLTMFSDSGNLLKKVSFPKLCLPVTVLANSLLNFGIIFSIFTIFLMISGNFPGAVYLALVPLVGLLVAFAIGLGVLLGIVNVFFRDMGQFFGIFITFWFWLTPIVYPPSILPEDLQNFILYNPLASLIKAVQGVLLNGDWPQWGTLIYPFVLAGLMCFLGLRLFHKRAGEIVDEL